MFCKLRGVSLAVTAAEVLQAIRADVHRDLPGSPDLKGIRARIAEADMITIDVGANNMLRNLTVNYRQPQCDF